MYRRTHRGIGRIVFASLMIVGITLFVIVAIRPILEYRFNGRPVEGKVLSVQGGLSQTYVQAMYHDPDGRLMFGEVLFNGIAEEGDEFTAYMIDRELAVMRMPSAAVTAAACFGYAALMLGMILLIISGKRAYNHGFEFVDAFLIDGQILSVLMVSGCVPFCEVEYADSSGSFEIASVVVNKGTPAIGEAVKLVCYKDKFGYTCFEEFDEDKWSLPDANTIVNK